MRKLIVACLLFTGYCGAADLTGNWVVKEPLPDGTVRRSYFDLKQEGSKITGHFRITQTYYNITESSGTPDNFTLTGTQQDGNSMRQIKVEGKQVGNELHLSTHRGPNATLVEMVALPAPPGEGQLPARLPLPELHKVPSNGLAKTPPMGWNSWNKFAGRVDDAGVRAAADAIASNGMREAGYIYVNIDDTWQGEHDAQGNMQANKKFPNMKALADYVHGKGLKIGIYSSPGPFTCAGYEGSYGHEEQDARTYAAWGIDYLKYDWCGARNIYKDADMHAVYQKMGDALRKTGRPIVYSLCQYGRAEVWKWGPDVGGNLWRTTGDIRDSWDSMSKIGFSQNDLSPYAAPGHWNDPDMLEVGNGGMTEIAYKTHMSLWAMLAAPLLAGNDLAKMTPSTFAILTAKEVLSVDQDPAGHQAKRVAQSGEQEVWARDLADGSMAVALFNRSEESAKMSVKWTDIGLYTKPRKIRDLWENKDVPLTELFETTIPTHGVVMLRVSK